jgi:hypothetical protein
VQTLPTTGVIATGDGAAVELPKRLAAALKPGTQLRLAAFGPEGLAAVREMPADEGFFCGSLATFSAAAVLGQVVSGTRTGRLILVQDTLRRTVSFRDGQILFASSTDSRERLGKMLVRTGILTQAQLDAALPQVKPGVKLGQALMAVKLLTPQQLYTAMTALVREIVLASIDQAEGVFLFMEGAPQAEDELKLPERTRDLLLQGVKRSEETARLRRLYPATQRFKLGTSPLKGAPELLPRLSAGADVATLKAVYQGPEHELLRWLETSIAINSVVEEVGGKPVAQQSAPTAAPAQSALDLYAQLIRTVAQALTSSGKSLSSLRSFFEDPLPGMEDAFSGVTFSDDGTLDVARIWKNLDADRKPMGKLKAYEAIDAFVSYALFSAKNQISPELADRLSRDFRKLHEEQGG